MVKPNAHILAVNRVANDRLDRRALVRLDKNEGYPPGAEAFIAQARALLTPEFLASYPEPCRLTARLSAWLGFPETQVAVTAGSDAAIKAAFELFVAPGSEVVIPQPNYAMYTVYAELFRAVPRFVPYHGDGMVPIDEIIAALNKRTALVAVSNPNSPVGSLLDRAALTRLLAAAGERGIPVLVDEAYYPYSRMTMLPDLKRFDNLLVTRTFSKALGLASARLGYVIASPEVIGWFAHVRPMYEINAFAEALGLLALDHYDEVRLLAEFDRVKRMLTAELDRAGLRWRDTQANFIHIDCAGRGAALVEFMRARGILVKPSGAGGGLAEHVRVTIGPAPAVEKFIENLRAARAAAVL